MLIGLTGGLASGKSTVCEILRSRGLFVVDADELARQVVKPNTDAHSLLIRNFGTRILNKDTTLNRKLLADIIFSNKEKRELLNSIVHPYVKYEIARQVLEHLWKHPRRNIILDVPLLYESGIDKFVDYVAVVSCSEKAQIQRFVSRNQNYSVEDAKNRIKAQMSMDEKMKKSDFVIDNESDKVLLIDQIDQMLLKAEEKQSWLRNMLKMVVGLVFFLFYWMYLKVKYLVF
jgi:dephospho-CoA kinase